MSFVRTVVRYIDSVNTMILNTFANSVYLAELVHSYSAGFCRACARRLDEHHPAFTQSRLAGLKFK